MVSDKLFFFELGVSQTNLVMETSSLSSEEQSAALVLKKDLPVQQPSSPNWTTPMIMLVRE